MRMNHVKNLILENTLISKDLLNEKLNHDWIIDSKGQLELGIVDFIRIPNI